MQLNSIPNSLLRIISGVLIGVISILVSLAPSWIITIFLASILLLVTYEFSTFIEKEEKWQAVTIIALSLSGGVVGYFNPFGNLMIYLTVGLCSILWFTLFLHSFRLKNFQVVLSSLLYPGLCIGVLAHYLSTQSTAYPLLLLFFTMVWSSDTGGYYFGRNFGRHKLLERISPKKTIEGLAGGGVTTLLCSLIWSFFFTDYHLSLAIFLAVATWLSCSYGDLVQSQLKRRFGIKDSSNLVPGHGGFFDRFDGFIFAAPFFVITHYLAG